MPAPTVVTAFSDFLCPWCYIGAVRLQRAAAKRPGEVEVRWKSFLLRTEPRDTEPERFRAYARSWARPAALEPGLQFRMWDGDSTPPTHSLPPNAAAKLATRHWPELADGYRMALFRAYFADNRTISDRAVLAEVAGEAGLPAGEFTERLQAEWATAVDEVFDDFSDALEAGVTAVPAVLAGGDVLRGASNDASYDELLERALAAVGSQGG